jgi:hypothetical protein
LVIGGATVVEDETVIENENQEDKTVHDWVEEADQVGDAGIVESKKEKKEKEATSFEIDIQTRVMNPKSVCGRDITDESYFVASGFQVLVSVSSSGFQVISKELPWPFLRIEGESAIIDFFLFCICSI